MKPLLKWVGGKTQILNPVFSLFPKQIHNYYEPFLGGGSVLLELLSRIQRNEIHVQGRIFASDLNPYLIGFYKNIQSNPEEVISQIRQITNEYQGIKETTAVHRKPTTMEEALTSRESYYYWVRSQLNHLTDEEKRSPRGSAFFLFLNKTGFRGLYRESLIGFNVPYGHYKNPSIYNEDDIRAVSLLLTQNVVFTECSFPEALLEAKTGDLVYFDPPYAPESTTSFVSYTKDGFDAQTHQTLFRLCDELRTKGVLFVMSNADVPLVRDAFPEPLYRTRVISCRRAIHSKKPDSRTNEVLIHININP